ncbi:hypothetical protein TSUD_95080 [Trifolium subterraneum]|uniref:Uncharacterized protein n=1 Tax=Trifolium subterraneum TaxID=3900 RepID=A0A2Z6MCN5_TRISU|nr:hypothetical protein TSUD_95080 [Trifolium subterraneum]
MINFILYEASPNINYNKKRKSAELATKCDAMISSTSKVPDKKRKMCSTGKEWFSKEKKNTNGVAKPAENKKEYLEILEDLRINLSRLMIHEIKEFIDAPIDLNFQMYIKGT